MIAVGARVRIRRRFTQDYVLQGTVEEVKETSPGRYAYGVRLAEGTVWVPEQRLMLEEAFQSHGPKPKPWRPDLSGISSEMKNEFILGVIGLLYLDEGRFPWDEAAMGPYWSLDKQVSGADVVAELHVMLQKLGGERLRPPETAPCADPQDVD